MSEFLRPDNDNCVTCGMLINIYAAHYLIWDEEHQEFRRQCVQDYIARTKELNKLQ